MGIKSFIADKKVQKSVAKNVKNSLQQPIKGVYQTSDGKLIDKKDVKNIVKNASEAAKLSAKGETPDVLKKRLEELVPKYKSIGDKITNGKGVASQGKEVGLENKVFKSVKTDIENTLKKLKIHNIKVKEPLIWSDYKVVYEGGFDIMNREEIKKMRLEVYEDASAGKISDNMKEYLLTYLEYVDKIMEQGEAYTEAVNSIIDKKRSNYIEFVEKSFDVGSIDKRQYEVMLEMAAEDFMFETPTPEDIPSLVLAYLEAAKEGDEEAKEEAKEKLDTAKDLEKIANETNDEVTEAACESLKDKIKELKIKLTDEEKEIVDKLDEKMQKAMGGDEEEASEESPEKGEEESESGESENDEETATKESVTNNINSSSLTDEEKKEMRRYIREAAEEGVYTEAEMNAALDMLK